MIDVTHSCDGHLWLDTPAMTTSEFEGGFLLPQLMGALASESIAAPVPLSFNTHQNKTSVLTLSAALLRALKLRFSPL
ncbi:hypothetical protein DKY63_04245 [Pseudomonas putida]|uniref:Uncharacterized protein n=1 Tax=Pseudomonas putida TaxID=303 RepID=A0A2Z4RDZ3_PSEPU|nr:hypothetical protein [Pseudomonas putida]AWY39156.1 hypothetical protein DKY63_04245 [Pseudomonas putida]